MQFVPTVASRPRSPSSLTGAGPFTARSATRSTGHQEEAFKDHRSQDPFLKDLGEFAVQKTKQGDIGPAKFYFLMIILQLLEL
jgi:hypothetical protein